MHLEDVQDALKPLGLQSPDLEMLRPTEARYRCLLLQPSGPIFAGAQRIGNWDIVTAGRKASHFLSLAQDHAAHLVVTPEYFFPWTALQDALTAGAAPRNDGLWVLGCESIHQEQLEAFKQAVAGSCEVLYEPCAALAPDRVLLDPAVMIFHAR